MNKLLEKIFKQGKFTVFDDKPDFDFASVHQIHSADIVTFPCDNSEKADGISAELKNLTLPLAIKTADCMPVLYLSKTHVAVVHAGWRGLRDKILVHPLLKEQVWDSIYIGPSISGEAFEVSSDFREEFPHSPHFKQRDNKLVFDLIAEARDQLSQELNFREFDTSKVCTFTNTDYNSYRKDKTDKRNYNIFQMN